MSFKEALMGMENIQLNSARLQDEPRSHSTCYSNLPSHQVNQVDFICRPLVTHELSDGTSYQEFIIKISCSHVPVLLNRARNILRLSPDQKVLTSEILESLMARLAEPQDTHFRRTFLRETREIRNFENFAKHTFTLEPQKE